MEQLTVRATCATLPAFDPAELEPVTSLESGLGQIVDFDYDGKEVGELRALELSGHRLIGGRITGLTVARAKLDDLRLDSVEFTGCDLSSAEITNSKLSRIRFVSCRILGGQFSTLTLEDVVFERCKLDYATFEDVQAKGPVVFAGCALTEATFTGCDLSGAAFDDCRLEQTAFDRGTFKGTDLRGNDLSGVRGVSFLKKIVVDRAQLLQLAEALAVDLDVTFGDEYHS